MTATPLVSVVIPAYNSASYLSDVIQSVLDQSYKHWELLIVDDGSTDDTSQIVNEYCELDSRIRLIHRENGGVSSARNLGVHEASGELIGFLDSDDIWLKEKLAVHVAHMREYSTVGVTFARAEFIDSDGIPTKKVTNNMNGCIQSQDFFYTNPAVTTSNIVIRRSVFMEQGGFDDSMNYSEDIDLLFRISFHSDWTIEGIDRVLIQYRLHSSGLSSKIKKMEEGWFQLMHKAQEDAPELVKEHYVAAEVAHLQYWAKQTLRQKESALLGASFVTRALISYWHKLYKSPKLIAIALLVYLRLITFGLLRVSI